jgi:hypothetical protein
VIDWYGSIPVFRLKNFFGLGSGCDIEFKINKQPNKKIRDSTQDDGDSTRVVFYDGEDVSGTVSLQVLIRKMTRFSCI